MIELSYLELYLLVGLTVYITSKSLMSFVKPGLINIPPERSFGARIVASIGIVVVWPVFLLIFMFFTADKNYTPG